jgi:hypothetical protein
VHDDMAAAGAMAICAVSCSVWCDSIFEAAAIPLDLRQCGV